MDRRRRIEALSLIFVLSLGVLAGLAVSAPDTAPVERTEAEEPYPGNTLITVQAYGWFDNRNGEAIIVTPDGERVWEYRPDDAVMFDGEYLENGNVLLSYGQELPDSECPQEWRDTPKDHCIENHVREVDPETDEVVWEYAWYDRYISHHEVHDADRLENGETVIIDMGQHRTFTVNQDGEVTWEWSAVDHLDEGSEFWADHVEGTPREDRRYTGPDQDWTHMNDVDRLDNGHFLLSIRNFDVLIEVDPATDDIVRVIGEPGNHSIMHEQHNPHYLDRHDHVIVADSENDRVVEYDAGTMEQVWRYEGPGSDDQLAWPRDADRLPNDNTLITDSRNFRVMEVNETGDAVWIHELSDRRAIVYDADRLGPERKLGEEPQRVSPGDQLGATQYGGLSGRYNAINSWLAFVFPPWVGLPGLLAIIGGCFSLIGLAYEGYRGGEQRGRTE